MELFKIPDSNYTDHYDLARFALSWRVSWFMFFVLLFLGFTLLSLGQFVFMPTFIGALTTIGFLVLLKRTRRYEIMAVIFTVAGTALCQFTLLFYPEEFHFVDMLWILIITLYTFFMLGKVWGVATLAVNSIGTAVFVLFILNHSLTLVGTLEQGEIIGLAINVMICATLISYLIFQFLNVIKIAENDFRQVNAELKEQNARVAVQNEEKTVMLREIHHRVKNNLQVITSLLRLQASEIEDENSREKFSESIQRVISMALIHEKMYQSEKLSRIDFSGYLDSLSQELIESYKVEFPVDLKICCSIDSIDPKSLVSIALIFNELISNSLKHAFDGNEQGQIRIKISEFEADVHVIYEDSGKWKPVEKESSFGLELIDSLCDQLNGEYTLEKESKTRFSFVLDRQTLMGDTQN